MWLCCKGRARNIDPLQATYYNIFIIGPYLQICKVWPFLNSKNPEQVFPSLSFVGFIQENGHIL